MSARSRVLTWRNMKKEPTLRFNFLVGRSNGLVNLSKFTVRDEFVNSFDTEK